MRDEEMPAGAGTSASGDMTTHEGGKPSAPDDTRSSGSGGHGEPTAGTGETHGGSSNGNTAGDRSVGWLPLAGLLGLARRKRGFGQSGA